MNIAAVKVLLEIVTEDINNIIEKDSSSGKVLTKHYGKSSGDLPEIFRKEVEELQEQRNFEEIIFKDNAVKKCIFRSLKVIFNNTTQEERVFHFDELIKHSYDFILQKLVNLNQSSLIITLKEFRNIVRQYLPLVKLDITLYSTTKDITVLQELIEYLKMPNILREDVYEISKKVLGHQHFHFKGYDLKFLTDKAGYLGEYAKLKVCAEIEKEVVSINCFIKFAPTGDNYVQKVLASPSFIKEELFYTRFVPLLEKLGITDLDFLPKCYLVTNNFVALEDLSISEYSMVQKGILDYEHLSKAVQQIAKLHSLSILAEKKLSENLDTKIEICKAFPGLVVETQIISNDLNHAYIEQIIEFLAKYPHIPKEITIEEFQNEARNQLNLVFGLVQKSEKFKNVVTHSDLWINNLFYKWNDTRPEKCILLDYQLIRYTAQVMDILMITHITATKDVRDKYSKILLREYYDTLNHILKKYDVDVEKISPYGDLLKSWEELKIYGIFVGSFFNYLMCLPKYKMSEINADPELCTKYWSDHKYKGEVLNSVWAELDADCKKKFEENARDLYDWCIRKL